MSTSFLAAALQLNSTLDRDENLRCAERLVSQAADRGARLVVLPELFNCLGSPDAMLAEAEAIPGPSTAAAASWGRKHEIVLVAGSIMERSPDGRAYNTSTVFGPDGTLLAKYRKLHLFDVDLPGEVTYQESRTVVPGDRSVVVETPLGRLGMSICYDLRFPELYRQLVDQGAEVCLAPSAFTLPTGRDHWELLVRARAVENQFYMVAANQWGRHGDALTTYGRSMIVDPWGVPLATAADGVGIITAAIDPQRTAKVRRRLPALEHRRQLSG